MTEVIVLIGGFVGGLASGLTGFGFGLSSLPFLATTLPPSIASPLVVFCSIVGQVQTLPSIWHALDYRRLAPFVICGLFGVPAGVYLLPMIPAVTFRMAVGVLLVVACSLLLWLRVSKRRESSRAGDAAVGLAGGVLGGITGLSGVLPTIWAELHGWGKDERRAIFQGYNFSILLFAFVSQAVAGIFTMKLLPLLAIAVPATIVGAWIGRKIYDRTDGPRFNRIVLYLLLIAGVVLVAIPSTAHAAARAWPTAAS